MKPIPPTSGAELEEALQQLDAKKQAWVDLQDTEKAKLLRRCIACTVAVRHLIELHMTAMGISPAIASIQTNCRGDTSCILCMMQHAPA